MRTLLVFLGASALALGLGAASSAAPALRANNDLIWDAINTVNGTTLDATYKESPENGLIDQTLDLELEDALPNTTVFVEIEGKQLGSFTTDAFGFGVFNLANLGLVPDAQGRAPKPRVETGAKIRVHNGSRGISATFQPRP